MREFTFDLQRFANPWQIERTGTTYSSLANACNAAQNGDTIVLLQSGIYGNGFTISKSVTIDLGGYTYTINDGSTYGDNIAAFGVASGSTVTFQNGTLNKRVTGYNTRSDRSIAVNATGSVVLNDVTVGRTVTSSAGTLTVTGSSSVPGGATTYILENGVSLVASASITLTTTADKTASIVASSGRTITATESDSLTVIYKVTASSVTFNYDADGKAYVTDLSSGKAFSVQRNNGATVTYTMSAGGLSAVSDNITKVWEGSAISSDTSLAIDDLDFDTSTNFTAAILTSSNVLTISNSAALKALDAGDVLKVVDDTDYTKSFGYLTKIDDNTYSLTKDSSNKKILSGIVINDDLTVQFDRNFQSVPITVTGSESGTTSLQAASANAFTLSNSNTGVASVEGAVQVSLVGGSLKTANAQTTIRAGSYTANYATTTGDGVNIIATTKATQISGIDSGEAFSVSGSRYYRDDTGLRTGSSGVFTSDIATISNNDNSLSIDLAKLKSSVGSFIQPDNNGVLEFGKTNTANAVVVNDTSSPTVKYAELLVDGSSTLGNAYTLRPSSDSNTDAFLNAVDTVSLTGGRGTTIYKSLVDDKVIAATSGTRPDATFKVTTSNDTFTVTLKTTSAETKISTDATGITLLSGTINAAAGQTITLGEGGRQFYVSASSSGMNVTVTTSGAGVTTATITGARNDTFTIDGTQYSVGNASDGMTFTVTDNNVIITDFETSDSDAFTYGGRTYSVQGAGFLMTQSGKHSLWSDGNNNHSLTGGSVTIESLFTNDHTWEPVETVDAANAAATLPPSDNDATVTLIGDDFEDTFGVFIKQGTAVTVTTGSADDEKKLSRVSVGSGIDEFFFGETLTDISIVSDVATFIVTEDDTTGGYQVSLTSSASDEKLPAMVGGARRASLITGSLQSDSYFTATVLDNRIIAQNDAKVILTATTKDASINGLKDTERFSVEGGGIYTMSKVGLVDDQSRYLLGTREGNPIILSELNGDTPWGGLIDIDDNNEITITSGTGTALVVDITTDDGDVTEATKLYADFTNINGTQSLRVANSADDWGDIVVNVQDTTVNFTSYFSKENIRGVRSGADFIVEDNSGFAVTDTLTGALIGTATNISLNSGTVSLTSGQTIHSKAGSITAATGNLTFTVTDDDATIGALDNKDVFSLQSAASTVEYTKNRLGIVTGDNRILTGKAIDASVTASDLLTGLQPETADGLWTNTVQMTSKSVLNIPQNVTSSSPWVILSSGKDSAFGTMETVEGGYSIHRSDSSNAVASLESDWTSGTFSINSATVTFTKDYSGAYISGYQSKASVNAVNALGDFMFTDGTAGATITGDGATTVNQRAGLVAPQVGQSIVAGTTGLYTISRTSEDNDIQVSVSGKAATVTGLSEGDEFTINDHNFVVLGDGVIRRDGSEYLQTGTSETAANLVGSWYGRLKINSEQGQNLTLTSALVGTMTSNTCYIVHENNDHNIYGTISRSSVSSGGYAYTLSTTGKNVDTFQSVTIATEVASVTFADSYFVQNSIPITAGDANFKVTSATNNTFAVNYDYTTQHAKSTATAVSLGGGTLDLSSSAQTITAGSNTVAVGNRSTVSVTYSDSKLTVGALDAANESVIISGYTYTYAAGNGMTIEVAADGTTTFKGLDDDTFTTASDGTTYTKTSTGFVKKNTDGSTYMWTNTDLDVGGSDGVNIGQLTNSANWTQIKALTNGELTIDSTSTDTVVLVGSETDPAATIYGTLTVSGATRTLSADGGKNAELTKITIDGVAVTIGDDYSTVPIVPQNGATINISTPMTFQPAVGTTFTVNYSGRAYEYNLTQSGSNYVLTLEGMSLTQSDNKYTLPGGSNWLFHEGTVSIEDGVTVTVTDGTKISGGGGYLTATAVEGKWTNFGSLTAGDKFSISTTDNSTTYEVLADGKTFGKYAANGEITQFLSSQISNSTLTYDTITNGTYNDVMTITDEGVLDLSAEPTGSLNNIKVYGKTNGVLDPTKDIGTVSYSAAGGYVLGNSGTAIGELKSISLGTVKTLTTTLYKPVTTASSGTFTVNNASFEAANSVLTIEPSSSGVALTGGKVNLTAGRTVLTGGGTVTASTNNTSAITVEVTTEDNNEVVTIGGLANGVVFNVNGTDYTMSALGLSYTESSGEEKLLDTGSDVTIAELNGQWETILDATGGTLTISPTTTELAAVVDKNSAIRYGTLTKTTSGYTFTQGETATTSLSNINLNGVTATLPSTTSAQITAANANGTTTRAVFTVTASDAFTVDATQSVPTFTNVTAVNLSTGTITADTDVRITVSGRTVTAKSDTGDQMTVSCDGTNATVGGLNAGDSFTVGNITYEVTSGNELYDTTNKQIVTTGFNASAKTYTISDDTNPVTLITLNNGVLNLTGTFTDGYSARIVQSLDDPSSKIATLSYSATNNTFTVNDAGDYVSDLKSITLPANNTALNTGTINTTVNTARGSSTYTINTKTFTAGRSALVIETTAANAATLTSGTVTLTDSNVVTPKGTVAATDGTVTVNVNGDTVTIGALGSGDEFTFGNKTYTMTTLGLRYDSKLYEVSSASVTTDDIADTDTDDWKTILEAPSGVLTIGTSTPSNIMVVDTTATPAVKYGTLEFSDNVFTFTQEGSVLNGVTLNGVIATLPASIADKTITTATSGGTTTASFSVTANSAVTVDASANIPTVSGMTAISLTGGTINAPENISITAGDYTIAATGGDGMTVSISGSTVTINSLNSGDTFTLGGKSYVYNAVGLFNTTDKARVTSGLSNGTLTLPATETQILAPTNGTLDLSNVTTAAEIYDSITNPTTKYADVTTSASGLTLDGTNSAAANITTVNIARGSNWTIDFVTDVTTTRGTVNGQAYTGTGGTITIHSDGSKSTLTDGTVTLTDANVPTAKGTIAATSGTITVNVNGETVTIGALDSGDEFTFGNKTYAVSAVGLVESGNLRNLSGTSLTTDDLSSDWQAMIAAPNGALTIGTSTGAGVVVNSTSAPTINYGTLAQGDSGYVFTQNTALSSVTINNVAASLPATSATITANSATFTATGALTIDATTSIPSLTATAVSLTAGTINAPSNVTVTVGGRRITATNGDMTIGLVGSDTQIGALNVGDKFTIGSTEYELTSAGLYVAASGQLVTQGLSADMTTYTVSDDTAYDNVITLTNGVLNLTSQPADGYSALIVSTTDGDADPTKKIASISYTTANGYVLSSPGDYVEELKSISLPATATTLATNTINTTVNTARGSASYTINGNTFAASRSALTVETSGTNAATLTSGTVTLTDTSVPTAKGAIAATNGTITVNVNGDTVTIGALGSGDEFTFGNKTYTVAAVGLVSDGALKSVGTSITTDDLSSDWQAMIAAPNGALTIGTSTGAGVVVNSTSAPTINYGTLAQGESGYSFTQNGSNTLSSVTINNVAASLPATSATITANSATFTASGALTVDATTSIPSLTATAVTLTAGTINAPSNVTVTVGGRRITATNGDMTIGLVGSDTQIGSLNVGDKFTIGSTEYELTSAGLYVAASGQLVTQGLSADMTTYTVSDDTAYDNVITLTNGVLNLTSQPADGYSALVVSTTDGDADPTKKIASISYTTANGYVLSSPGDYVEELKSISLPATATTLATNTINTTVNTARGSASYTINGNTFAASRSALTVETSGTNAATLTSGTVTLTDNSVDTAKGSVAATNGTLTVNVNGDTVTIGALGSGDEFTFGNKTYTVSAVGLVSDGALKSVGTSITTDDLSDGWQTMIAAPNGALTIGTSTGAGIVVNSTSSPTINYGTLTQGDSGYVFTQNTALSSVTINNVAASLPATSATITANSATFTATGALTIDATTSIPSLTATAVSLTAGTINAPSNVTVTISGRRITATNGDMTIGLVGSDTQIGALNVGDKFTIGNTEYELTSAGLYVAASGQLVTQGLSADMTTYTVSDDTAYDNVITLTNGVLNLTSQPADGYSALVVSTTDGDADPTKKIASISYTTAGGYVLSEQGAYFSELQSVSLSAAPTFSTALETTVTTASTGTYTINAKSFTASNSALTVTTASNSATLTGGRVSLAAGNNVTTPSATLASTAGTVTVNVSGSTVTVGSLSSGKAFTVDDTAYTVSAIGLVNDESLKSVGSSVTLSDLGSDWQTMIAAPNGALIINTTTGSDLIVVNSTSNPTVNYGTLSQDNSVYTFTANAGSSLSSITLNGVTATLPATSATITANGATFTATATDTLTVDASTTVPTISGVSALNLTAGTINAPDNIPVTVGGKRITATGGDMSVGIDNNKVFVGDLNIGDTFTVGSVAYELTSAGLYIADSGQLVTEGLSEDMTTFIVDDAAYGNIITLDENGNLDLTATPANGYTAFVAGLDDDANPDPSKNIATVQYTSAEGYTLTAGANVEDLKSVSLNTVKNLNTLINTTVTTPASGTFVINGKTFAARSALEIETAPNAATLTDGTITLAAGYDVTTPNDTIASTAGTLTVNVDGSTVTIGNLSAGKGFSVNDKPYTMTSIGLSDGTSINDISSSITTDQLSGDDWKTILAIENGALSINADTPTAAVIDITDPAKAIRYGMLTKSGLNYSFDTYGSNALKSITLSGVSAAFDSQSGATLSANDATFSLSASGSFTVDATSAIPSISGASAISLTAGSVNAPLSVPVTVGSRTITNTNGSISVGISSGSVFVSALNAGDTFTVDKTNYLVTAGGELYDASNARMVTAGFNNNTFTLDDAAYTAIIQVSGTNLNLSNQSQNALVYDSISNPNTRLATLNVTGSALTLTASDDNIIRSVDIAAGTTLTIDFDATVNAAGSATVNGEDYSSTGALVIISDSESSSLYEGALTLNPASATPKIYNDASTLAVNSGSVVANVADGYYSTLSNLNNGESFSFNGTAYTQTNLGLVSNGSVAESLAGSTIDLSRLASANWAPFLAPDSNRALDLQGVSDNAVVYDDLDNPSKKLADLIVYSDSGRLTLNGSSGAANAIASVLIDDGDNLSVNFATQVSTSGGTVNGLRYNGAGSLTIDAKSNSSSLFDGTLILNAENPSAKATKGSAISVGDGTSIYATANSGRFVEVSDLATGESFTYGGTTYTQTAFGLVTNGTIREDLAGSSVVLDDLSGTWSAFLAPKSGTLDLSSVKASSVVYDSATAPARRLAGLTVSGSTLTLDGESSAASYIDTVKIGKDKVITLDFTADVTAPKGSVTVNGKEYDAQTDVTLTSDSTSSTLTKGTIKVAAADSVTATSGNRTIANAGDKALNLDANGATLTVSNLSNGSVFAVDGSEYLLTNAALFKTANASEATPANSTIYTGAANVMTSGSITVAQLDEDAWGNLLELPSNGALTVTALMDNLSTTGDSVQLVSSDLANFYGTLTKTADGFSLTKSGANANLTAINVNGTALVIAPAFLSVPLAAGDAQFSSLALSSANNTFTVDDTGSVPALTDNVSAFKLDTGAVHADTSQTVTAGKHTVSGDVIISVNDATITVSEISSGEEFTLDGKTYKLSAIGLVNVTDTARVTAGFTGNTLTVNDMEETAFIGATDNVLDLTKASASALVYDSATAPTKQIGTLTVENGALTLRGTAANTVDTISVASGATLTVDFAAQVEAPQSTVTVNGNTYRGTTALTLYSDGTTSSLSGGTVALTNGGNVTTTSGNSIAATAGDGLTVTADSDTVTIGGLNAGDEFTVDGTAYKVNALAPLKDDSLWTGEGYSGSVTVSALTDGANWTRMHSASYGAFAVNGATLENGDKVILVDNTADPTTTYGTLTKPEGEYILMKDDTADEKLASITVATTIINIDTELADVPITTINADVSESVFTVKPYEDAITFRVDATGNSPRIDGVYEIDLISGKVEPQDGQIVKPADGTGDITLSYGNGTYTIGDKTITIGGLQDGETVDIDVDANGNIKNIHGLPKDSYVIIDDTRYTAPFDEAVLTFDEDGWYFEGYTLPGYSVTIDKDGNISVDTGIRLSNVISSGKTLGSDGKIELSGERGESSVTITNESEIPLNVSESDGSEPAENLAADEAVTFSQDGVEVTTLSDAAGATFNLNDGQRLTDGTATLTSNGEAQITVGEDSITVAGSARIEAPADTELTLGAAEYEVNGVEFTSGGTTQATTTAKGVEIDLANSDGITYDEMRLSGAGEAIISGDDVTLSGGATAENTTGKTLTVDGLAVLDDKTVNTAEAVEVTSTAEGLNVGDTTLTVGGDGDGYQINIEQGDITGLENIGSASGVTVGGLSDASIHTDKASALTVGDKTFMTNDNSVTWIDEGSITGAEEVNGWVSGDFSDGLTINGTRVQVTSGKGSNVSVAGDDEGVTGVLTEAADEYNINGKTYETSGRTAFVMDGGKVTGAQLTNGLLGIGQNETDFGVNDESLTLSRNSKPVTLGVIDSAVREVYGLDGSISGLSNAAVYELTKATVNGVPLDVSGTTYDAEVAEGTVARISGLSSPATINSAPNMEVVTGEDGSFTFEGNTYNMTDTVDSSVTFTTDANSNMTGINDFAGSVSGAVTSLNLNGKAFGTNDGNVTVASNGTDITRIEGVKNGDSISGDLDSASFYLPQGNITINGGKFTIEDDSDGAEASSGGKVITGLAKDASLTVGTDGSYRVNSKSARASVGGVFTVNRDGSYLINPEHLPIIEKTPAATVRQRGGNGLELVEGDASIGAGADSVVVRNNAQATVDVSGEPLIVATSGSVTLQNYAEGNASIGTFEYTNIGSAIRRNSIMFGDGVMTLGDAVITFDEEARSIGATRANLVNAQGKEQAIGFTHTAGGTINAGTEAANLVLKGNYAEKSSDTQKSGASELTGGSGNDLLLIGAGDSVNGGEGNDRIYVTDGKLRNAGAVIYLSAGKDTVHHFNGGYGAASDKIIISDLSAIEFEASNSSLVMRSGDAQLTFKGMAKSTDLVTSSDMAASADMASNFKTDGSYRLQLQDGNKTYNAAVAQSGKNIGVVDGDAANVFYGKNSGINFSEYTGAVSVNLNDGAGNIGSQAAQFHGINKLKGGAGSSTLLGAADVSNTLIAGTGDGQIWSNSGKDLLIGNTSADKTGSTTFRYLEGDGQDTITGFAFGSDGDMIDITTANAITSVKLSGSNVLLEINGNETDYLTLAQGKGNDFRINNLVAKVDDKTLAFDGEANCYVAQGNNARLQVSDTVEAAQVWLNDATTGRHGTYYLGDIRIVDGSKSAGNLILTGNDLNNTIIGGSGTNSIWGGYGYDNDVLIGGAGKNTFFFALVNGNDVIQGAHDGDVIDLGTLTTADIAGTAIGASGAAIALTDGSILDVRSNAAIEYKTAEGTYTADHATGQWIKK